MKKSKVIILVILTGLLLPVVFSSFYYLYYPFCKLSMFESDYNDSTEFLLAFEDRVKLYSETLFLKKGQSFKDIPLNNGEKVNIRLGWDNSITVTSLNINKKILVSEVHVYYNYDPKLIRDGIHSMYSISSIVLDFKDVNNDSILICRQPDELLYGKRLYGFGIAVNGKVVKTGNNTFFDY